MLVPAALGFGSTPVLAPYAAVPANSALRYDIELVRVSARGPDAMMKVRGQQDAGVAMLQTLSKGSCRSSPHLPVSADLAQTSASMAMLFPSSP